VSFGLLLVSAIYLAPYTYFHQRSVLCGFGHHYVIRFIHKEISQNLYEKSIACAYLGLMRLTGRGEKYQAVV